MYLETIYAVYSRTGSLRVRLPQVAFTLKGGNQKQANEEREETSMARVKMVTRTVEQTTARVMCLRVDTAEVSIEEYTIGGSPDNDELLKKLKTIYETDNFKVVAIQDTYTETKLLGMSEEDFIRYAQVLPPRKNYNEEEG